MFYKLNIDKTLNAPLVAMTDDYIQNLKFQFEKTAIQKKSRSKSKAEVFTPTWLCNKMNNHIDDLWFGRNNVFNVVSESGKEWISTIEPVLFSKDRKWRDYVLATRLEITCGEAPFIVSRYDSITGKPIPIDKRIGILDRKLRIISENCSKSEWQKWAVKAYRTTYGYEYQIDNLLLARFNLVMTYIDYYKLEFDTLPADDELAEIIDVINWNIFNMDGLRKTIPGTIISAKIMDWSNGNIIKFDEIEK